MTSLDALSKAYVHHEKETKLLNNIQAELNQFWDEVDDTKKFVVLDEKNESSEKAKAKEGESAKEGEKAKESEKAKEGEGESQKSKEGENSSDSQRDQSAAQTEERHDSPP